MTPLVRALSAELLKLRRTLALWMCLIAPATVVVLLVLQMARDGALDEAPRAPAAATATEISAEHWRHLPHAMSLDQVLAALGR